MCHGEDYLTLFIDGDSHKLNEMQEWQSSITEAVKLPVLGLPPQNRFHSDQVQTEKG